MKVKCDYCGKIKDRKPSDLKGKKNHFCSMECFSKWLKATGARKGKNNPKYGTKHSEETLEKIRTNVKEALAREEVREKLKGKKTNTAGYKKGSDFPLLNDKEWLYNKYWTEGKDLDGVAEIVGCNRVTVWNALKRLGIQTKERPKLPPGFFKNRNHTEKTKEKIGKESKKHWEDSEYRKKLTEKMEGRNNPNWQGGKSFEPYCFEFNDERKEHVREKYGRRCFLCSKTETENGRRLSIHHIDYDKDAGCNGKKWLLIPLCVSCHTKTNYNREYWKSIILTKIRKRKLSNAQTIIDAFAPLI